MSALMPGHSFRHIADAISRIPEPLTEIDVLEPDWKKALVEALHRFPCPATNH
jgi:hypothetical protein